MADTITTYIGNGTQTDFSIPFDYLKKSFIRVTVDGTLLTGGDYGDTSVDYYFLDNTTVRLKVAPASEAEVTIRRYTSATERIVSFEDASILKATDLDTSQLQSFHIAEEARDVINDALIKDEEENWDAQGHRITNVGDPVGGKDAINLDWYNEDAGRVQANADLTEQWKDETKGYRDEAESFKEGAEESHNLAKDWAIKMDGKVVEDAAEVDYSAKYWATSIKEYGVASIVVADNIEDVKQVSTNIEDVKLVGGDLEGLFSPPNFTDMGRVGTGSTDQVEITGGNIKTVADNIGDVQNVGTFIESGQAQIVIDSVETTNQNVIKAKQWAEKTDGEVEVGAYSAKYWAQQAVTIRGQSDWNEDDPNNRAYIKNKPDLTVYALKTDISTIYRYKGSVDTYGQLPVASQVVGDVYNIATDDSSHGIKAGDNVAWNGTYWDNLSGYVDLSPYLTIENAANIYLRKDTASTTYATKSELSSYATKQEVTTGLAGKSDTNHTHTVSQVTDFTSQVQSLINISRITDYGRVGS